MGSRVQHHQLYENGKISVAESFDKDPSKALNFSPKSVD